MKYVGEGKYPKKRDGEILRLFFLAVTFMVCSNRQLTVEHSQQLHLCRSEYSHFQGHHYHL